MDDVLPPYEPSRNYGMFGYQGFCCDTALRRDDPEWAEACWHKGWLDCETRMLIGTVMQHCEKEAPKVAERLHKLGPCINPAARVN